MKKRHVQDWQGNVTGSPGGAPGQPPVDIPPGVNEDPAGWVRVAEIIATMILSVATVCTAWSAFQATKWSGIMTLKLGDANGARTEYTVASTTANQKILADLQIFSQWLNAIGTGNEELAQFYYERHFSDELRIATDAWLATNPGEVEDAPDSPFEMDEYTIKEMDEAEAKLRKADELTREARQANQRGDNYTVTTVLFASVLFFAGIASKLRSKRASQIALAAASIFLLAGIGIIASFPIVV